MLQIEQVESRVPFGHDLFVNKSLYQLQFDDSPIKDPIEQRYLAWETVRKKTNPYFIEGTGFEGYLVGTCTSSHEALETILNINQHILDAIARLYHFDTQFQSRLMQTLAGEVNDPAMTHIWSAYLGAELGMLRVRIPRNKTALLFQTQTYQIVSMLPKIAYQCADNTVRQKYAVGYIDNAVVSGLTNPSKIVVHEQNLNPSQQTAWYLAKNVGQFGHPLVRKWLDKV